MENIVVLNVDDNSGARHAKTRLLLNAGFRVEEAADGATALSMVDELCRRSSCSMSSCRI